MKFFRDKLGRPAKKGEVVFYQAGRDGDYSELFAAPQQAAATASSSTTITYEYDALNRLTEANYSTGQYYYYEYDAAGNRTGETTQAGTTAYVYDDANRLSSVGGVSYSYDANGNLLSDGTNTYTYDYANHLSTLTDGTTAYSYTYNGRGDRLQQTVDGVTTTYTLDLVAGLTQIISDGTAQYLYGYGRLGEYSGDEWAYYTTDALGSVRQIVAESGEVVFYQAYEPYGEVLVSAGEGGSNYGYAGEWTDASGLQYLRSRYYNTGIGSFLTRDTWGGDYYDPLSLNRWAYVQGNPVRYTDPSGMTYCVDHPAECWEELSDHMKNIDQIHDQLGELISISGGDASKRGNVTTPPPGISWNPSVIVGESSEAIASENGVAQNQIDTNGDGEADIIYPDSPGEGMGPNLCGQIAMAMILEDLIGNYDLVQFFYTALGESHGTTKIHQLAGALQALINQRNLTQIKYWAHNESNRYQYNAPDSEGDITQSYMEPSGRPYTVHGVAPWYMETLAKNHYLIVLGQLDTGNGGILVPAPRTSEGAIKITHGHWVVITGMSSSWDHSNSLSRNNWVRIMNPYLDREEYYWWGEFSNSTTSLFALEIWKE